PEMLSAAHVFLGAWKDDQLAGFLLINEGPDWVEIEGCYSRTTMLTSRPNDALMFHAMQHYLTQSSREVVGYGLSSIQRESNEDSLHFFKTKIGYQAVPVHRAFVVHPLLSPFVNRLSLSMLQMLLGWRPRHRLLKKDE